MNCVKLLGQSLMARDFARQVAELQVRTAVLNGYTALGIPVTRPAGISPSGKGGTPDYTPFARQSPLDLQSRRHFQQRSRAILGNYLHKASRASG